MPAFLGICGAVSAACCASATDIATKSAMDNGLSDRFMLVVQRVTGAIVLSLVCLILYPALLVDPVHTFEGMVGPNYWWVLVPDGMLQAVAFFFYIRAFRYGEASLVAPLTLFTPVLLLITSPIMLGERIPLLGVLGVLSTVVGVFFLGSERGVRNRIMSIRILLQNKGARSMLLTAAIWSISSNLDKMGVLSVPPIVWGASISIAIALFSLVFMLALGGIKWNREVWRAIVPGVMYSFGTASQMYALSLLFVPYVLSIRRISALFTVVLSGKLFKEDTSNRMVGTIIMLLGIGLIALGK